VTKQLYSSQKTIASVARMVKFSASIAATVWALTSMTNAWISPVPTDRRRLTVALHSTAEETITTMLPEINLFNSKSRSKEPLKPLQPGKVSIYTCGPTVYDYAHVGNFRAFLTYDLIKRVLLYFGYDVTHICNLTDVDDKIINRANDQGIENILDLTRKYEDLFLQDLKALNVIPADEYPRATEHIPEMMEMILQLEEKDLAYESSDGSWWFATDKKEGYGEQLVNLNWDEMETTERGESDLKRTPQDFCLWKAFKPSVDREDAAWESPRIKKGRPGWHLECSAMSRKYLGDTIDIHGGGVDLKFPHHENEIAQSEGASGCVFCNCWVHNGFVNINDEKMSKSLGNFLTLRGACPKPSEVRAYRYLVTSSLYRNSLSFTSQAMDAAKSALKRIDKVREQIIQAVEDDSDEETSNDSALAKEQVAKALQNFEAALKDDLSMPRASASLFGLIKEAEKEFKRVAKDENASLDLAGLKSILEAMDQMDKVFGIFYQVPTTAEEQAKEEESDIIPEEVMDEVMDLVYQRAEAKEGKDWNLADSLRAQILELGFTVKDVKGGDPLVSRIE
jgi:cysteinyl-tRNA synthetase